MTHSEYDRKWSPVRWRNGETFIRENTIWEQPLRRKKPTTYRMEACDLFHPNVPDEAIDRAFAVMALAPQHVFQVLTKHPERMRDWMQAHTSETWMDLSAIDFFYKIHDLPYFWNNDKNMKWLDAQLSDGTNPVALCCKPFPWPNVWLGVSVEDQPRADERIPLLLDTPAAVRFISAEPLLGPVDVRKWIGQVYECSEVCGWRAGERDVPTNEVCSSCGAKRCLDAGLCIECFTDDYDYVCPECGETAVFSHPDTVSLDWVIVGGESGKDARPMHPDWARSLRDQCADAGVPFFFKQNGEWLGWDQFNDAEVEDDPEQTRFQTMEWQEAGMWTDVGRPMWMSDVDGDNCVARVGKKAAGRTLDGQIHDALPSATAVALS